MQPTLFNNQITEEDIDVLFQRARRRECIEYGEHFEDLEEGPDGSPRCFNCQESL